MVDGGGNELTRMAKETMLHHSSKPSERDLIQIHSMSNTRSTTKPTPPSQI
ncbi:hypothetical protein YC2023_071303 [Brassica napus]